MSVLPRAVLLTALVASFTLPVVQAGPDECLEYLISTGADGIGLRLLPGSNSLGFTFYLGQPGDGMELTAIITPGLCSGLGVGLGGSDITDPAEILDQLPDLPPLIPLP